MTIYHFPAEAGIALAGGLPTPQGIAKELDRLGLPHASVRIACDGEAATLEGTVPDREVREQLVVAVGNLRGIGAVDDQLTVQHRSGLLDTLGAFATLPAGSANTQAAEAAVHHADPEIGEAYGPGGSLLHIVRPGETLQSIAQRHYGDPHEARRILEANVHVLGDTGGLQPGLVLRVPPR